MLHYDNVGTLITELRREATDARACFRTLATQAMGLAVVATGAMLAALEKAPEAALAGPVLMAALMAVQRIGTHKFGTANRLYGYQLHLERLDVEDFRDLWSAIGWEEAFRAWRIVQPTVFSAVYRTPQSRLSRLVADLWPYFYVESSPKPGPRWWVQADRVANSGGQYHSGGYLRRVFAVLEILAAFSLFPLGVVCYRAWFIEPVSWLRPTALVVLALGVVVWVLNLLAMRARRLLLEDGMLSIHACAIMWKAVVIAHLYAWRNPAGRAGYTERLARHAAVLRTDPRAIRTWLDSWRQALGMGS